MGRRTAPLLSLELPCSLEHAAGLVERLERAYRLELLESLLWLLLSGAGLAAAWGLGAAARLLLSASALGGAARAYRGLLGVRLARRLRERIISQGLDGICGRRLGELLAGEGG